MKHFKTEAECLAYIKTEFVATLENNRAILNDVRAVIDRLATNSAERKLVEQISRFVQDGEMLNGEKFDLTGDDAIETLHSCIKEARRIVR